MTADSRQTRPSPLKRYSAYIGLAIGIAGIAFVTRLVIQEWDDITEAVGDARLALLGAALLLGLLAMGIIGLNWLILLRRMKAPAPPIRGFSWYFVGQLGKYVPGGIWPVVGRAELATRAGVTRRAAYTTTATSMFATYFAAGVTGAALLPAALGASLPLAALAAAVVVAGTCAVLNPRLTGILLAFGERIVRRPILARPPAWGDALRTLAGHVPAWIAVAASTWAVSRALSIEVDFLMIAAATPLAWLLGFVIIGLPGGLGVRESIFVAIVATETTNAEALSIALLARMVFVAVDILGAAGSTLLAGIGRGQRKPGPGSHATGPEQSVNGSQTASPAESLSSDP